MCDKRIEVMLFVNREVPEPHRKRLWLQSRDLAFFGYCCPDAVYAVCFKNVLVVCIGHVGLVRDAATSVGVCGIPTDRLDEMGNFSGMRGLPGVTLRRRRSERGRVSPCTACQQFSSSEHNPEAIETLR